MTEQEKNKLAELNGYSEDRYTDKVKEEVKKEQSLEDEVAILRKAVAHLYELHEGETPIEEFAEYNSRVEAIKAEAKDALGI